MNLLPLDDRIVVKPLEAESKTSGGILIPDSAKEKQAKGKVLAVGPGRMLDDGKRAKPSVKVGDVVIFGKYAGNEVEVDGEELSIMRESELLAIIE